MFWDTISTLSMLNAYSLSLFKQKNLKKLIKTLSVFSIQHHTLTHTQVQIKNL